MFVSKTHARNKLLSILGALAITAVAVATTTAIAPTAASAASGTVSGVVYRDWNYSGTATDRFAGTFSTPGNYGEDRYWPESWWNGQTLPISDNPKFPSYQRGQEPGEAGIQISVTDSAGAVSTATTGANGTFSLSVTAPTNAVRVEMIIPSSKPYLVAGPKGARSGGNVQFVNLGTSSTNLYFSVANPNEYCKHDSSNVLRLITPCFKYGDQKSSTPLSTLESLPFDTPTSGYGSAPTKISEANANQIGTTYGLAWDPYRQNLFAAAYMRRHAGFGPFGTGAIYKVAEPGSGSKNVSVWADLNSLFGAGTAGADPHPTGAAGCSGTAIYNQAFGAPITTCQNEWGHDVASYDKVGKISLGDMDISDDGASLFVVNMNDKRVYKMSSTVAPTSSGDVTRVNIPTAASGTSGTYKCANDDSRPMALTIRDGVGYVGVVCSQESGASASDPRGYIYKFDPVSMSFTNAPVLSFRWDGNKKGAGSYSTNNSAWTNSWVWAWSYGSDWAREHSVQPIISSIVFDNNDIIVGVRNRHHDQIGNWTFNLNLSDTTTRTNPMTGDGGMILRACPTASGWAVEGDTAAGFSESSCTASVFTDYNSNQATNLYGGNSMYDAWMSYSTQGSMVLLPGTQSRRANLYGSNTPDLSGGKLIHTFGDPAGSGWSGGIASLNASRGWALSGGATSASGYTGSDGSFANVYAESNFNDWVMQPSTFGKTNGLGDLEVLCLYAPIDIGDRVWSDTNGDGLQGAEEPGMANVTVRMMQGAAVLATASTDSSGNYLFSSRTGTNTTNSIFGVTNLKPGQNGLSVKVDVTDPDIPAGAGLSPSASGANRRVDSDALADGATATFNIVTSHSQSFDYDFGFCTTGGCTPPAIVYAIGAKVWTDTNANGIRDTGELPLPGITVQLRNGTTGAVIATTTTNTDGIYVFDDLTPGSFRLAFSGLASGETWTTAGLGSDPAMDSDVDPATGLTPVIALSATSPGLRPTIPADLAVRATRILPVYAAGKAPPATAPSGSTTICLTPT
jgi:hypothetical protein